MTAAPPTRATPVAATGAWLRAHWPIVAATLALAAKQGGLVLAFDLEPGPLLAVTAVASSLALVAPAGAVAGRAQVAAAAVLDALGSAVLFADLLHQRHYGDVFSAASLRFASQLGAETGAVAQLLRPRDLLLFADLPLLLLAGAPWGRAVPRLGGRRVAAAVLGAVAVASIIRLTDPTRSFQRKGHAWPVRRLGPLVFHAIDFGHSATRSLRPRTLSPEEVAGIAADLSARRESDRAGGPLRAAARGRNLLVVQVESLQGFALGARVGGAPATPHLDALARESIVFDRFHEQTGLGVTSDADYAFNCSGHPLAEGAVYVEHADAEFRCLPALLSEQGYATAAFQAIWPWFWNLATAYPRIGYQRFDAMDDYTVSEFHRHGLTDRPFVAQTLPRLAALREPFFAYVVTLTSHVPFDFGEPLPVDPAVDPAVARYLSSIKYADHALGELVGGLRRSGLLDRTVLAIYGDHHALKRGEGLGAFLGLPRDADAAWFEVERRVPLLIRLPRGAAAGRRDTLGGQVDLAPTLASLLGVDVSSAPFFGHDLLAGPAPLVAFPDGSATDGRRIHDAPALSASPRCLDAADGRRLPAGECAGLAAAAAAELRRSRALVEDGLLKALRLPRREAPSSRPAPPAAPR